MKPGQKEFKRKSPMDFFFSLGDKVTKGDPKKKADFDYYMMWIIFIAFFSIFIGNIWEFIQFQRLHNLGWAGFGFAIMWFQYSNLRGMREMRKITKEQLENPKKINIEKPEDMLKEFER